MIRIDRLGAKIKKTQILSDISLSVGPGEFLALVGPNGAGKTTLLKHLNGLMKPSQGSVFVGGLDTRKTKTSQLARSVGFLFQNPDRQILCQTVRAEIEFGLKHCGLPHAEWQERTKEAAERVGLGAELESDPLMLTRSKRQRVALASVLATQPRVLVLDEPTSAQDEAETLRVMGIAQELCAGGKTVILVSHDMRLVSRYASRVIVLVDGRIAADTSPEGLFSRQGLLERARLSKPGLYRMAESLGISSRDAMPRDASALADLIQSRMAEAQA
jgi:energy-coupling factor transport system ATP-binding protein